VLPSNIRSSNISLQEQSRAVGINLGLTVSSTHRARCARSAQPIFLHHPVCPIPTHPNPAVRPEASSSGDPKMTPRAICANPNPAQTGYKLGPKCQGSSHNGRRHTSGGEARGSSPGSANPTGLTSLVPTTLDSTRSL
jgi:hypothetical protein